MANLLDIIDWGNAVGLKCLNHTLTTKENKMKATIEFNLPDDASEHRLAINGQKYWSVLYEFNEELRRLMKHGLPENIKTAQGAFEEILRRWRDETEEIDWAEIP